MIRNFLIYLSLITYPIFGQIAPPNITPHETWAKAEEILAAHACYKDFTPEIAKRTLLNFLDEIDPLKCYLTEEEIGIYLTPSDDIAKTITQDYKHQQFTTFFTLYETMLAAIERRNNLEEKILNEPLPTGIKAKEIHMAPWCKNGDELRVKLLKIRSLQMEAASKLTSQEEMTLFFQRLQRRRISHEKELIGGSKIDQKREALSFFLKSFSSSLDTHTMYFTPYEAKQFMIQVHMRLFGIGAVLKDDLNGLSIVSIVEGGPAARGGDLKVGDKIIAVNHEPVIGMDYAEAVELIRGPEGSKVILTVLREKDQKLDIMITRGEVIFKESRYDTRTIPYGDGVIGYLALHSFYQDPAHSSYSDLKESIEAMKREYKLYGVILDLRNNGGGLLSQAAMVTGLFIKRGVVAAIRDNRGQIQKVRNLNESVSWDGPLVVLTNRASASASEIVALALSDYSRAIIVGDTTTYGKGSYQTFTLESANPDKINQQGEYKVTRGAYYTVGGKTPQLVGVPATIEAPGILAEMEIGEKYAKYPLKNDSIEAMFQDDFSDVHPLYRSKTKKMVGNDPQKKLSYLDTEIPKLQTHSKERIAKNANYQNFLVQIHEVDRYDFDFDLIGQNDLQFEEGVNVMKELIFLSKKSR